MSVTSTINAHLKTAESSTTSFEDRRVAIAAAKEEAESLVGYEGSDNDANYFSIRIKEVESQLASDIAANKLHHSKQSRHG